MTNQPDPSLSFDVMFIFGIGWPGLRPGRFRSTVGGRPYRRYWCGPFYLVIWPGDDHEFGEAIKNCEWVK